MSQLAQWFSIALSSGIAVALLALIRDDLEPKFFRMNALVGAVMCLVALFLGKSRTGFWDLWMAGAFAGYLIYAVTVLWLPTGFERLLLLLPVISAWVAIHRTSDRFGTFSVLSGGALMGAALVAMNVGHWYLSATKMSIRPLKVATAAIAFWIAVRFLTDFAAIPVFALQDPVLKGSLSSLGNPEQLTLLSAAMIRVLFGLVGPGLLVFMTWGTVRIGSTQSATGILYALLAMTLAGEASAFYLLLQVGIPA